MSARTERRIIILLLAGYALLALIYSVVTPPFEASDELWHYPMVKYMADNSLQLPPQDPLNQGAWRQEGSQPPLYYMLAAILTSGIDTSDMENVRRINPHADIGIIRPDGNANMMVHRANAESFPWQGTILALQISRIFSIILSVGTLIVTYAVARELFAEQPHIRLAAVAFTAFLPMFVFISASVNNDNLSNLLGNLITLLIVRLLKQTTLPHWRTYAVLGIATGAGLLAKLNIGFLIPIIALSLLIISIRLGNWRPFIFGGVISGGLTILIAGWWYLRNWQLYQDPTGLNMFLSIVGRRAIPANAAQLWSERDSFLQAYWGFFGGVNVPMPTPIYAIFNVIGALGILGVILFIVARLIQRTDTLRSWLPYAVTIIWIVVSFVSYLRWTAETPASQGRLLFGALASLSIWLAVGLSWWLPHRWQPLPLGLASAYLIGVSAISPFAFIAPAYALPQPTAPTNAQALNVLFAEPDDNGELALINAQIETLTVEPESYVLLTTDWAVRQPLARDWSIFVHLVTPDGVIISQRDVYPAGGKLATSDLTVDTTWHNPLALFVPSAAYAPMTLDVEMGWYHLPTGERLTLPTGEATYTIGQVELVPREDNPHNLPNPITINFGDQIELIGYALNDLSPQQGGETNLTLYWRAIREVEQDYVVFAQIIDPMTTTIYAASDAMPAAWSAPTSTWQLGQIIEDTHTLVVNPNTPPNIYEIYVGLYLRGDDGSFNRLRVITTDGGMAFDYTSLTRVRVLSVEVTP
jgi:4-amino-4-deoxy-L-arabinose transferase-like glycosyltransferase